MNQDIFTPEVGFEQPPRKKNILLIVIIFLAVVAAAALPLTFYLMFFRDDALLRSVNRTIVDLNAVSAFEDLLYNSDFDARIDMHLTPELTGGAEALDADIGLSVMGGSEPSEPARHKMDVKLSVNERQIMFGTYFDNDILAVRGLDADKNKYIGVNSDNVHMDFSRSVFYKYSGSDYALDDQSYSAVVDTLREYIKTARQIQKQEDETEELDELLDVIYEIEAELNKMINKKTSFGFTMEAPFVYRQIRIVIDDALFTKMCEKAISILKENTGIEYVTELVQMINSMKSTFSDEQCKIELIYRISGGRLTYAYLLAETPAIKDKTNTTEFILDFDFGFSENKARLEYRDTVYITEELYNIKSVIFESRKTDNGLTLTGSRSSDTKNDEIEWTPVYNTTFDFSFITGKDDSYEVRLESDDVVIYSHGKIDINKRRKTFVFDIESLRIDGQDLLKGSELKISIKKRAEKISEPEIEMLSEMTVERQEEFAQGIQVYEIKMFIYALQASDVDMPNSVDGYPIAPAGVVNDKILQYSSLFRDYIQLMKTYGIDGEQYACVYDRDIQMYVLLEYVDDYHLYVKFLHIMTDEFKDYHKGRIIADKLEVHDFEVTVLKKATCSAEGEAIYTCSVCGYEVQIKTPLEAHRWIETETNPSTCTEHGYKTYICKVCGESMETELPLAEHSYEESECVESTCIEHGYAVYTCSVCGYSYSAELSLVGHSYTMNPGAIEIMLDNGEKHNEYIYACSICGEISSVIIDNYFQIYLSVQDDGTYFISRMEPRMSGSEIPVFCLTAEMFPGIQISGYTDDFSNWYTVHVYSIRFPDGIKKISVGKLQRERMAKVLVLPSTLEKIENGAFDTRLPLKRIYFTGTARQWADVDLGKYRDIWSNVEIIFAPDGVKPGEFVDLLTGD